jgi:hypothetical protein
MEGDMIGGKPAKENITILQGSDFVMRFTIKNPDGSIVDLTGSSFAGQIRRPKSSPGITEQFDVTKTGNEVSFSIPKSRTSAIPAGEKVNDAESIYFYDIEWTDSRGITKRFLEGRVSVSKEVTR